MRRLLSVAAIASCLVTGISLPALAQSLPGLTIFGGPRNENQLNFRLDYGTRNHRDRYRLRIPADKRDLAIAQLSISYPDYYDGEFDPEEVEVRVKKGDDYESVPIELPVMWDRENHLLEIYPIEPIPAGYKVEVVLHDVQNPRFGGMYYFNCRIQSPGDVPLLRYLGTWVINIS